jgi:hypothetical protein
VPYARLTVKNQFLAIAIALGSALCFALASVLQQRAASEIPQEEAVGGKMLGRLVRRPIWLAGIVFDTFGYLAQAGALAVGSLLVVQPLLVTTLLFALPLGRFIAGRHVYATDWLWAGALTLSLGVFIDVGNPTEGVDTAPLSTWLPSLIVIGGASGAAMFVASKRTGRLRALLLAVPSGALFGLTSALTKSVVDVFDDGLIEGIPSLLTSWETYAVAVSISVGFVLQQSAYQAGSLKEALPAMIVLDPVVAMGIGAIVLQETLDVSSATSWVIIALALVAMVVATVQLSRSSAIHEPVPV